MRTASARLIGALLLALALGAAPAPPPSAGDVAFAAGDFDAAAAAYASVLAKRPQDADANLGLATIALYHNDVQAAAHDADAAGRAARGNPRLAQLRTTIAERSTDADGSVISPFRSPVIVPFEVTDPLPLLHVIVNGRDGLFFIDTGAANMALDPDFAKRAGVTFGRDGTAEVPTIELGAVLVHRVPVDVRATHQLTYFGLRHADGLIGTRFLEHFVTTIDYIHGDLMLRARADSDDFERDAIVRNSVIVPMLLAGDHNLLVRGRVNGGPDGWLSVDTALPVSSVPSTLSVTVGTRTQRVEGLVSPPGGFGAFPFPVLGAVSQGYFRNISLTLDFAAMRLVMQI